MAIYHFFDFWRNMKIIHFPSISKKIEMDFPLHGGLQDYNHTITMPTREEIKSYQKKYYLQNRERILEQQKSYQKKYYLENRERILEQQKKYLEKNRQKNAENEKMLENIALADALKEIKLVSLNLILSNII